MIVYNTNLDINDTKTLDQHIKKELTALITSNDDGKIMSKGLTILLAYPSALEKIRILGFMPIEAAQEDGGYCTGIIDMRTDITYDIVHTDILRLASTLPYTDAMYYDICTNHNYRHYTGELLDTIANDSTAVQLLHLLSEICNVFKVTVVEIDGLVCLNIHFDDIELTIHAASMIPYHVRRTLNTALRTELIRLMESGEIVTRD